MRAIAPSLAIALLHSACAATAGRAAAPQKRLEEPKPIPPECAEAVRRAARLGEAMFMEDKLAAWATDALFAERILPGDPRVRGWVFTRGPGPLTVHFLGGDGAGPDLELYQVEFRSRRIELEAADAHVVRIDPPRPPSDEVARMFQARRTAIREPFGRCSDRYNTVVLPPAITGEDGWVVYLLAATTKPEVVLGGHVRRLVSADGATLLRDERLSTSCLTLPLPDPKSGVEFLVATSAVSACPLETHVFLSFLHAWPFMIANRGGIWSVRGREIRFLGRRDDPAPDAARQRAEGSPAP